MKKEVGCAQRHAAPPQPGRFIIKQAHLDEVLLDAPGCCHQYVHELVLHQELDVLPHPGRHQVGGVAQEQLGADRGSLSWLNNCICVEDVLVRESPVQLEMD